MWCQKQRRSRVGRLYNFFDHQATVLDHTHPPRTVQLSHRAHIKPQTGSDSGWHAASTVGRALSISVPLWILVAMVTSTRARPYPDDFFGVPRTCAPRRWTIHTRSNNFINCASSFQRGGYSRLEKVLGSALETMKSLDRVKNHDISRILS